MLMHPRAGSSEGEVSMTDDEIRKRAHAIWEQEGRPEGCDQKHWQKAKRELEAEEIERRMELIAAGHLMHGH